MESEGKGLVFDGVCAACTLKPGSVFRVCGTVYEATGRSANGLGWDCLQKRQGLPDMPGAFVGDSVMVCRLVEAQTATPSTVPTDPCTVQSLDAVQAEAAARNALARARDDAAQIARLARLAAIAACQREIREVLDRHGYDHDWAKLAQVADELRRECNNSERMDDCPHEIDEYALEQWLGGRIPLAEQ